MPLSFSASTERSKWHEKCALSNMTLARTESKRTSEHHVFSKNTKTIVTSLTPFCFSASTDHQQLLKRSQCQMHRGRMVTKCIEPGGGSTFLQISPRSSKIWPRRLDRSDPQVFSFHLCIQSLMHRQRTAAA